MYLRSAEYVNLLDGANHLEGPALRNAVFDAEVLVLELGNEEFSEASWVLADLSREDPPGQQGGWDGKFRRGPYTRDGAEKLSRGVYPRWLRGTLRP